MAEITAQKPKFSVALQTERYQKLINNTLQDPKRAQRFIASISSAVATNPALQECDAGTILAGALLGESLNLSPSPQLGQYYLVPFEDKKAEIVKATFILGYKGYIQLAIRSGQYKKMTVMAIKRGELIRYDPLDETIEVNLIQDEIQREVTPTVGYYAMFEYVNGFRKAMYWSKNKMIAHANRYSAAFSGNKYTDLVEGRIEGLTLKMIQDNEYIGDKKIWEQAKKMSSFWYKDFDSMAYKTMLRQLISKWGVMSIEMLTAVEQDNCVINQDGTAEYVTGADINAFNASLQTQVSDQIVEAEESKEIEQSTSPTPKSEPLPPTENSEPEQVNVNDL